MTTDTPVRNPFAERHQLRADIQAARVARDAVRGRLQQIAKEKKQAEADAFKHEMDMVVGTEGAEALRDAALERARSAEAAEPDTRRGQEAAEQIIKIREGQLELLYDDPECFDSFCKEAESATSGAIRELQEVRAQLVRAGQSWAKATSLWRPLNKPLRKRLEELNEREGAYPNVAPQAAPLLFPISLPSDLATAAPRPPGINRLRAAQNR